MANEYVVGQVVELSIEVRVNGSLTDPTDLTLTIQEPDGTQATEEYNPGNIVNNGTGIFYLDLDTTGGPAGRWTYRWVTTGTAAGAAEGEFIVKKSLIQ